jgi:hypothetical protein
MPRESGASSTPRLLDSITGFSGILGRPVKPGDDEVRQSRERVGRISASVIRRFTDDEMADYAFG